MSIQQFENDLALVLSSVEENERTEYIVAMTIGSMNENREVKYDLIVSHDPNKIANCLEDKVWYTLPHLFVETFGALPTTVVFGHIFNVAKHHIVELLSERMEEAAKLPAPQSFEDVEFRILKVGPSRSWVEPTSDDF